MQYKITILPIDSEKQDENLNEKNNKKNISWKAWTKKKLLKGHQNFLVFFLIPFQLIALWYVRIVRILSRVGIVKEKN